MYESWKQEVVFELCECVFVFSYLCKFNKAAVSLQLPLICLAFIGHNTTDLINRQEHPFFIVLHCSHEDVGQVLQQLDLK